MVERGTALRNEAERREGLKGLVTDRVPSLLQLVALEERAQEGGLPRAAATQDGDHGARFHLEIQPCE